MDTIKFFGGVCEIWLDAEGKAMYTEKYEIVPTIMRRDGLSREDARQLVAEAREEVMNGADPEELLAETFGLEPDYVMDLLSGLY